MSQEHKTISITLPYDTVKYWAEKSWYTASNELSIDDQNIIKACTEALNKEIPK